MVGYGRAQRGVCTAEDGRKAERSSAPYAEAYSPYVDNVNLYIQNAKKPIFRSVIRQLHGGHGLKFHVRKEK